MILATAGLFALSSCSLQPEVANLSSGTNGGYYHRLGQQMISSADTKVSMTVRQLESQGSRQNLQRLLDRQVDFALVQLDVASEAMRQGKVQAVLTLSNEHIHVIAPNNSPLNSLADLQGKRVAVGTPGSGIRFTSAQLLKAAGLTVREDESDFDTAIQKLRTGQLDAMIYVGGLGGSKKLRTEFETVPALKILPIQPGLVNYITIQDPGSYQAATIPLGTYNPRPEIPAQPTSTLSTATVLATRPDVSSQKIGLLAWAIISSARQYSQFYPELKSGDSQELLQKGILYIHPAAQDVFLHGDPRSAWIRYLEGNNDLQAGIFIIVGTSILGLIFQQVRRERSKKLITTTNRSIAEFKTLLPHNPQQAMDGIEDLRQEHRLQFIDGTMTGEVYEQIQQKTQMFADQCRNVLEQQRRQFILDNLLLLDEWQATLQSDSEVAMQKLGQLKQQYREMLLAGQVDIEAYIELMELTLMSVMTLTNDRSALSQGTGEHPVSSR
ncbi:TRAP ABC transporter substrate-binding protein [Leptolyngbya sp. 'hensonii']|nr:TRAP ABC transporter substrate-binding protein [Leptolyngbya sp. 'hensonii']